MKSGIMLSRFDLSGPRIPGVYICTQILNVKKKGGGYSAEVKWEGYPEPSWHPFSNVKVGIVIRNSLAVVINNRHRPHGLCKNTWLHGRCRARRLSPRRPTL